MIPEKKVYFTIIISLLCLPLPWFKNCALKKLNYLSSFSSFKSSFLNPENSNKNQMKTAGANDTVKVHYTCITNDGEKFSSRDTHHPITLTIGKGKMLKPLEDALIGMKINEKRSVYIQHEQAYGSWKKELVRIIDRSVIPDEIELKEGLELYLTLQSDSEKVVKILEVKDTVIIVDENHCLAGKDLEFEMELIEIL
jgi:FKBP-type peptidyl-prolyl cis-trans isomerase 2